MTSDQIHKLATEGIFPESSGSMELVETHISWVIVGERYVYKIKKPVQYSFLDFSTIEKRKYFCTREIELNKRLAENVYIDVQPVYENEGKICIGGNPGTVIDYAVRMHTMDRHLQMDQLLVKNKVTLSETKSLAEKIAFFHQHTNIIYNKNFLDVGEKFNDLEAEKKFLAEEPGEKWSGIIAYAIDASNTFLKYNSTLLEERLNKGFFRDCHGDLHSRNIFLLPAPVPFDCIEFNDDFRQIDVLNEVAFLCMDLDAFEREDLSALFIDHYNLCFPTINTTEERSLFLYYKSYRANIRAKVNSLRARSTKDLREKEKHIATACKYLLLMEHYLHSLKL